MGRGRSGEGRSAWEEGKVGEGRSGEGDEWGEGGVREGGSDMYM